jgi:hypothetical protein
MKSVHLVAMSILALGAGACTVPADEVPSENVFFDAAELEDISPSKAPSELLSCDYSPLLAGLAVANGPVIVIASKTIPIGTVVDYMSIEKRKVAHSFQKDLDGDELPEELDAIIKMNPADVDPKGMPIKRPKTCKDLGPPAGGGGWSNWASNEPTANRYIGNLWGYASNSTYSASDSTEINYPGCSGYWGDLNNWAKWQRETDDTWGKWWYKAYSSGDGGYVSTEVESTRQLVLSSSTCNF